ncbi:MAG: hypothetical protein JRD93_13545 [Deltaproteobacteria bacterium]|nr:hypothetical protein [Deltaproteobacteria bacterium]
MKLFASDMWSVFNFADPNERYQKFLARGRDPFKHFIEGVLLYDEIVVPTQDFMSLSILVGVLGELAVIDLLEAGVLTFIRLRGSLAYIGNGGGIKPYQISSSEKKLSFCASIDKAVSWALGGLIEKPKNPKLPELVVKATHEIDVGDIYNEVRHETYMDVLNSTELRNTFALRNTDMDYLAGVGPSDVRIYGGPDGQWCGDEVDIVMALAATNIELRVTQLAGCEDASSASPIGQMLKAKAFRTLGNEVAESFVEFREIAGVPDICEAVFQKQINIAEIRKLAHSRDGAMFREWFHENCRSDPVTIGREYVSLLKQVPRVQSFSVRGIRFITTTLVGQIPILGQLVAAVDSFFVDSWFRGHSPKFFVDKIVELVPQDERDSHQPD